MLMVMLWLDDDDDEDEDDDDDDDLRRDEGADPSKDRARANADAPDHCWEDLAAANRRLRGQLFLFRGGGSPGLGKIPKKCISIMQGCSKYR